MRFPRIGVLRRQPLEALQPIEWWRAVVDRAVNLYEIRMGNRLPGGWDGVCRRWGAAIWEQHSGVMGCRSGKVRCQRLGLGRQISPAGPLAAGQRGKAELVKDHTAVMPGAFARDDPALDRLRQRLSGRLPSPFACFEPEPALDDPGGIRTQSGGALGQAQRRASVTGAQCLVEETAKAEGLQLGAAEPSREQRSGLRLTAPELGRLN